MYSFSKIDQLSKTYKTHRDPYQLRKILGVEIPSSEIQSKAQRFGKCSHPRCGNVGTIDRPLDLHHIVPRSQSRADINNYINHLYLCGDRFVANHHKSLHGEATPGLVDWRAIGFFANETAEEPCSSAAGVDGIAGRMIALAEADRICRALARQNVRLAYDYAIRKGVIDRNSVLYPEDIKNISNFVK